MPSNQANTADKPFCLGIFTDIAHADQAIAGLLAAGFDTDHISVICSNQAIEQHFAAFGRIATGCQISRGLLPAAE